MTASTYRCRFCQAEISEWQARLYGQACSHWRCQHACRAELAGQKQEARRRTQEKRAELNRRAAELRDELAADSGPPEPAVFLPAAVPANRRPLTVLPAERKEPFRENLRRVIAAAFAEPPPPAASTAGPPVGAMGMEETGAGPIVTAACALCEGYCCRQGREHAYLLVETVRRYRAAHPGATGEDVLQAYEAYLGGETYADSCVFHHRDGCRLPRSLRSATCNEFICDELGDLQRRCAAAPGVRCFFLVAFDGVDPVRCRWLEIGH